MVRAVTPIPFVKARFFDRCGKPLTGGQIYTYEANTTTPKVTYKDPYGLTPNTNPIILDAAGEADIYLDGTYRIRITDRNDVLVNDVAKIGSWFSDNLQDTLDNISGAMDNALKPILQNLDDAINTAAAAGAGANGWTDLLVRTQYNRTMRDKLSEFVSVKDFGAVGDGVTDDTTALQNAFNSKKRVYVPEGVYLHTGLVVDYSTKQAHLEGAGWSKSILKCVASGKHSITIKNTGTGNQYLNFPVVRNLAIDGDNTNSCGIYVDGVAWYVFDNLKISHQGSHGIYFTDTGTPTGGSYIGVINKCYIAGNTGDGINQVATKGADQQNASWISNCEIQGNKNGISVWGCAITITNASIEGNKERGINIATTNNSGVPYPLMRVSVKDNYFEANNLGQVYVKTSGATGLIEGLSIEDNYFSHLANTVDYVPVKFKSSAASEVFGLSFKGNKFLNAVEPNILADFGNGLAHDCIVAPMFRVNGIPDFASPLKYINLGSAKFNYIKSVTPSGYFYAKSPNGVKYTEITKSDNVTTAGSVIFPIDIPLNSSLVQVSIPVETDSTNYTIQMVLRGRNINGVNSHSDIINVPITSSGTAVVKTQSLNAYVSTDSLRVKADNADMYLQVYISATTFGTYFYLGNPTVFYNCV